MRVLAIHNVHMSDVCSWASDEPSSLDERQHCAQLSASNRTWANAICDAPSKFICQSYSGRSTLSAVCTTAGQLSAVRTTVGQLSVVRTTVGQLSAVRTTVGQLSAVCTTVGQLSVVRTTVGQLSAVCTTVGQL